MRATATSLAFVAEEGQVVGEGPASPLPDLPAKSKPTSAQGEEHQTPDQGSELAIGGDAVEEGGKALEAGDAPHATPRDTQPEDKESPLDWGEEEDSLLVLASPLFPGSADHGHAERTTPSPDLEGVDHADLTDAALEAELRRRYIRNGLYVAEPRSEAEVREAQARLEQHKVFQATHARVHGLQEELHALDNGAARSEEEATRQGDRLKELEREMRELGLSKGIALPHQGVEQVLQNELLAHDLRFRNLVAAYRRGGRALEGTRAHLAAGQHRRHELEEALVHARIAEDKIEAAEHQLTRVMEKEARKQAMLRKLQASLAAEREGRAAQRAQRQERDLLRQAEQRAGSLHRRDDKLTRLMHESLQKAAQARRDAERARQEAQERKVAALQALDSKVKGRALAASKTGNAGATMAEGAEVEGRKPRSQSAHVEILARRREAVVREARLKAEAEDRKRVIFEKLEAEQARQERMRKKKTTHGEGPNRARTTAASSAGSRPHVQILEEEGLGTARSGRQVTAAMSSAASSLYTSVFLPLQPPPAPRKPIPLPRAKVKPASPVATGGVRRVSGAASVGCSPASGAQGATPGMTPAAFTASPATVVFKDYEPEQTYTQRISFTNNSGQVNCLRLLPPSPEVLSLFDVHFTPPQRLSAGITFDMSITFHPPPLFDKDSMPEELFLSFQPEFGEVLRLPLCYLTRRCDPVLASVTGKDMNTVKLLPHTTEQQRASSGVAASSGLAVPAAGEAIRFGSVELHGKRRVRIDFGTCMVGQQLERSLTLDNCGILSTQLEVEVLDLAPTSEGEPKAQAAAPFLAEPVALVGAEAAAEEAEPGVRLASYGSCSVQLTFCPPYEGRPQLLPAAAAGEGAKEGEGTLASAPKVSSTPKAASRSTRSQQRQEQHFRPPALGQRQPVEVQRTFLLSFAHPNVDPIVVECVGRVQQAPMFLDQEALDFACMITGQTYTRSFALHSAHPTAIKYVVDVDPEWLAAHGGTAEPRAKQRTDVLQLQLPNVGRLEIGPRFAFVQPGIPFEVDVHLTPSREAYVRVGNELWTLPLVVRYSLAGVDYPISMRLLGRITTLDVGLSYEAGVQQQPSVSAASLGQEGHAFGRTTLVEQRKTTITLHNRSHLPQEVRVRSTDVALRFLTSGATTSGCPEVVAGTEGRVLGPLGPGESVRLVVLFEPRQARLHTMHLVIRNRVGGEERATFTGEGVAPSVEFLPGRLDVGALALGSQRTQRLRMRLSKDLVLGPDEELGFLFLPPILKSVQSVGEVEVAGGDASTLAQDETAELLPAPPAWEALGLVQAGMLQLTSTATQACAAGGRYAVDLRLQALPDPVAPGVASTLYGRTIRLQVPCALIRRTQAHVAADQFIRGLAPPPTSPSVLDVGYLELQFHLVPETFTLDRRVLDFGAVPLGERVTKMLQLRPGPAATTTTEWSVQCTGLNPEGPFALVKALPRGGTETGLSPTAQQQQQQSAKPHAIPITFAPRAGGRCAARLLLHDAVHHTCLPVEVVGVGALPEVHIIPDMHDLDLGDVLVGQTRSATFTVANRSDFPIPCRCSLAPVQRSLEHGLDRTRGTVNVSGRNAFALENGSVDLHARSSHDFTVTFSPDRESDTYHDTILVHLWGQQEPRRIQVRGRAWSRSVVLEGYQPHPPGFLDVAYYSPPLTLPALVAGEEGTGPGEGASVPDAEGGSPGEQVITRYVEVHCPWVQRAPAPEEGTLQEEAEGEDGAVMAAPSAGNSRVAGGGRLVWAIAPTTLHVRNLKSEGKGSTGHFIISKVDASFAYDPETCAYAPARPAEAPKEGAGMSFTLSAWEGAVEVDQAAPIELQLADPRKDFWTTMDGIQARLAEAASKRASLRTPSSAALGGRRRSTASAIRLRRGSQQVPKSATGPLPPAISKKRDLQRPESFDVVRPFPLEACFRIRMSGGSQVAEAGGGPKRPLVHVWMVKVTAVLPPERALAPAAEPLSGDA